MGRCGLPVAFKTTVLPHIYALSTPRSSARADLRSNRHFNGDESFIAFPDNPADEKEIPRL
jgi:hypothetical protein